MRKFFHYYDLSKLKVRLYSYRVEQKGITNTIIEQFLFNGKDFRMETEFLDCLPRKVYSHTTYYVNGNPVAYFEIDLINNTINIIQ